MNSPFGPNSSNCAAVVPKAGPDALPDRENTYTRPFESTATPGTSPKLNPGGSFRKSGTDSNGISGTAPGACARATGEPIAANSRKAAVRDRVAFIGDPLSDWRGYSSIVSFQSRMTYDLTRPSRANGSSLTKAS